MCICRHNSHSLDFVGKSEAVLSLGGPCTIATCDPVDVGPQQVQFNKGFLYGAPGGQGF